MSTIEVTPPGTLQAPNHVASTQAGTLRKDGIMKIIDGITTPDEILRVTQIDLDVD